MRYLILLVALFALAIWILSVDVEKAGWLKWMTNYEEESSMNSLVDRQIVVDGMIGGYSNKLRHPVWLSFVVDSINAKRKLERLYENRYWITTAAVDSFQGGRDGAFVLTLHNDQAEMLEEVLFNAEKWYREWGEISIVAGIVDSELAVNPDSIRPDNPPDSVFVALMQLDNPDNAAIGFIFPQRHADHSLPLFAKSVDLIEDITGIGIFNDIISDLNAGQRESNVSILSWGYNDSLYLLRTNK